MILIERQINHFLSAESSLQLHVSTKSGAISQTFQRQYRIHPNTLNTPFSRNYMHPPEGAPIPKHLNSEISEW